MFHYVDPNEEYMTKMEIFKRLKKQNEGDRGLGATKQVAESIDALLKSCEDIETQANIVLKSLDQSLLRGSTIAQDNVYRLYVVLRQGLQTLSQTTFRQIPKTDIKNLTDYRDTLTVLYASINDAFLKINEMLYGNKEPLNKRSIQEYKEQTGKDYRQPVSAQKLQEYLKKQGETDTQFNAELRSMREKLNDIDAELAGLEDRADDVKQMMKPVTTQLEKLINLYRRQSEEIDSTPDRRRKAELSRMNDGLAQTIETLQNKEQQYNEELQSINERAESLPNARAMLIDSIQKQEMGLTSAYKPETLPLSPGEYDLQLKAQQNAELAVKDYELIMTIFDTFINTLNHGLTSYTTGISGRFNKSQDTNYRTPSDIVIEKMGSGRNISTNKIHRRFL